MGIYSIGDLGRRELLTMSAVVAGFGTVISAKVAGAVEEAALQRTPGQILARIIHRGAVWPRDVAGRGMVFRGAGDAVIRV